jgi:Alginate lyase
MLRRRLPVGVLAILLTAAGCSSAGDAAGPGSASASSSGSASSSATAGGTSASSSGAGAGAPDGGGAGGAGGSGGLNPQVAPGGNFDLSLWELQEPVGSPGSPTTILPAALEGPNGYHDTYFFTDPTDGAMTFWDPENGVTTANSDYPRCELRELNANGTAANWPIAGTNTLSATVEVVKVPDHVCVGQIHIGSAIQAGLAASTKPLLELYYYGTGDIELGIEDSPAGSQTVHDVGNVPLGTKLSYTIQLAGDGTITLVVNGVTSTFTMPASFNGYGMYFKAGDYDQTVGTDGTVGATVKLYALHVSH